MRDHRGREGQLRVSRRPKRDGEVGGEGQVPLVAERRQPSMPPGKRRQPDIKIGAVPHGIAPALMSRQRGTRSGPAIPGGGNGSTRWAGGLGACYFLNAPASTRGSHRIAPAVTGGRKGHRRPPHSRAKERTLRKPGAHRIASAPGHHAAAIPCPHRGEGGRPGLAVGRQGETAPAGAAPGVPQPRSDPLGRAGDVRHRASGRHTGHAARCRTPAGWRRAAASAETAPRIPTGFPMHDRCATLKQRHPARSSSSRSPGG